MRSIQEMSPREIDARIAEETIKISKAADTEARIIGAFERNRINPGDEERKQRQLDEAKRQIREHSSIIDAYEAEFTRRGGWNRVFIVVDGHIHRTTSCRNGYYLTTDWRWLPDWSDRDWDEIMADAGERMCSWCFPDAPTEYRERKARMEHPTERERREAREKREAERAAKAAAAEAKKVYDAEGNQVRDHHGNLIKTERSVAMEITDCLFWARISDRSRDEMTAHAWYLVQALAAKRGEDPAKLYEKHVKKARDK